MSLNVARGIDKSKSWQMFDAISAKYDFLNRVLSLGLDTSWRRKLAGMLPHKKQLKVLDLATGTGDVAFSMLKNNADVAHVYGVDMASQMLMHAQEKSVARGLQKRVTFLRADIAKLPQESGSFDAATIAFGIRNVPNVIMVLQEMFRVLKLDGCAIILEFSLPKNPVVRAGHRVYLRYLVPWMGWLFSGNYHAYNYLNKTIESFPYGERFSRMLKQVGFIRVDTLPLLGGTATIYRAYKV